MIKMIEPSGLASVEVCVQLHRLCVPFGKIMICLVWLCLMEGSH